jgi:hypothetical protein
MASQQTVDIIACGLFDERECLLLATKALLPAEFEQGFYPMRIVRAEFREAHRADVGAAFGVGVGSGRLVPATLM